MAKKFLRRTWSRYAKLGKGRKKKQVWRRPTGRDNKMRERRKGYPAVVSIGYKKPEKDRKEMVIINNIEELKKVDKDSLLVLGNLGKKKKIEILEEAQKMKIEFQNVNTKKFLKKNKIKKKEKKPEEKKSQGNKK